MATKPAAGSGLPSGEDLDKVAAEEQAKAATGVVDVEAVKLSSEPTAPEAPAGKPLAKEPDSNITDSRGATKEGGKPAPMGGRGVNAPRDAKPAPSEKDKRAAQPKITVTDKHDNAGKLKDPAPHGIRGVHTSRDTYRT
jgi:hypothetical protein